MVTRLFLVTASVDKWLMVAFNPQFHPRQGQLLCLGSTEFASVEVLRLSELAGRTDLVALLSASPPPAPAPAGPLMAECKQKGNEAFEIAFDADEANGDPSNAKRSLVLLVDVTLDEDHMDRVCRGLVDFLRKVLDPAMAESRPSRVAL